MKTTFLFLSLLFVAATGLKAQNLIAVQGGTKAPKFYTKLPEAIEKAVAGDTVYIPGGSFDGVLINKRLCLIGAGHNPDSTSATARTLVQSITLDPGAAKGSITGLVVQQLYTNGSVNTYTISRCNVFSLYLDRSYTGLANFTINENIISHLAVGGTNHLITNNIFIVQVGTSNNSPINFSTIKNNIFLLGATPNYIYPLYASNCNIENNIFEVGAGTPYVSSSTLFNNFNGGVNGSTGDNQGSGNILTTTPLKSIFVSYDPTKISGDGIYKANFAIRSTSSLKNAGRDGTDMGIYGGIFPWKAGSIPFNPHFQNIQVAPKTDANGNLSVHITVKAQDN